MNPDDKYEQQNDFSEGPTVDEGDNDYASRGGQSQIPVQKDEAPVEDPIDPATADSNAQLGNSARHAYMNDQLITVYSSR